MEAEPLTVLLIDDDPALLRLLKLVLRSGGFRTCSAVDGAAALAELEHCKPDAIVLDIEMPVMDGRTFYRILRSRGYGTPVLVLSAKGAAAARDVEANDFLSKPFNPSMLTAKIRKLVA